jgi:glycosyltransferase involved in cell wall biosynthesis
MPLALLEAMSSGLPCVATRLAGSTDVIIEHDVNGVLVEPDDEHGFAMAIESLLTDRGTAQQLGNAARLTALERYAIERAGVAWMAAYRELATS